MLIILVIGENVIYVISVYAPQVGLDYWNQPYQLTQEIPLWREDNIGGEFIGHAGNDQNDNERVHGGCGFWDKNDIGEQILDFIVGYDIILTKLVFKNSAKHLLAFKSGTIGDKLITLLRRACRLISKDYMVIAGENLATKHRIMVFDIFIKEHKKTKDIRHPRTGFLNLKGDKLELFKDKCLKKRHVILKQPVMICQTPWRGMP